MVKRYIEGGYGLSEMEEDEQGDWVSYEDYEALRQKLHAVAPPQDDGWIEWGGWRTWPGTSGEVGMSPLSCDTKVEVKTIAGISSGCAGNFYWGDNIVAYRVVS